MSQDTVYISAAEKGLIKWDEFRKPPYSAQDYLDAYNNGVKMAQAFKSANDGGASKVVLEKGNYPVCYSSSGAAVSMQSHSIIDGTDSLEIDGGNSCLFVIFDSNNRSPYHTNSSVVPSFLPGCVFMLVNNTNLNLHNFNLRGDQYNRAWVANEQNTEQTYGIWLGANNINTKIDIVGHGFRGDAVSGNPRGTAIAGLDDNWTSGGIDNTGAVIGLNGAYHSPLIDVSVKDIKRNAVQIMTTGYLRNAQFRNDSLDVLFFNSNNVLILREKAYQCDFIHLPTNCKTLRFVAYDDERTSETVGYGNYLFLATGSSDTCLVEGEYYANHRGAVSNLCNNTTVDANIHDNGTLKYGFPHYSDTTRYGVNFEDIFIGSLTVKGTITNGVQGVLCNSRSLKVSADISNMTFSAVSAYSTLSSITTACNINNVGTVFGVNKPSVYKGGRVHAISNCIIKNSKLYGDFSDNSGVSINIKGNEFFNSSVSLVGDGNNLSFDNNNVEAVAGRYVDSFYIGNARSSMGNTINRGVGIESSTGWSNISVSAKLAADNYIGIKQTAQKTLTKRSPDKISSLKGCTIKNESDHILIPLVTNGEVWSGKKDVVEVDSCNFIGGGIVVGEYIGARDFVEIDFNFKNVVFTSTATVFTYIMDATVDRNHKITFSGCTFNLDTATRIIDIKTSTKGTLSIEFNDCTFISKTQRSLPFVKGAITNVFAIAKDCKFINVTNAKTVS